MDVLKQDIDPKSLTNIFWCHTCRFEFKDSPTKSIECPKCHGDCCEEIDPSEPHPKDFIPFSMDELQPPENRINRSNSNNSSNSRSRNHDFRSPLGLGLSMIIDNQLSQNGPSLRYSIVDILSGLAQEDNLEEILQYVAENDPNQYGNPPASEKAIKQLKKILFQTIDLKGMEIKECSVCKEDFKEGDQALEMPCTHKFHDGCLTPWLKQHNSCPTCRFELVTDDIDYEKRKNSQINGGNNNNNQSQ